MNRTFEDLAGDLKFKDYLTRLFAQKTSEYSKNHILEIELTNKCSIGCFYCGATTENNHVFLDFDLLCDVISRFSESRTSRSIIPYFSITGGDPIEYPHFEKLLTFLKKRDTPFMLKMNPSTITGPVYKMIADSPCDAVKLTFMGVECQAKYRKKDTLKILSSATERFLKDNFSVIWHFSIGEFNRQDLLESLGYVLKNRPSAVSIGRLARVGKLNEQNYPADISPLAYREFLKQILLFFYNNKRNGFNLVFKEKLWIPFLCEEGILSEAEILKPEVRLGCDAGERLTVLTYAGDLITCGLLPDPVLSRVGDQDFFDSLMSVHNHQMLSGNESCLRCRYINVCRGCRGVAEGAAGKKDPQCWL